MTVLQPFPSSHNLSFSLYCQFFPLFLMFSRSWLNHLLLSYPNRSLFFKLLILITPLVSKIANKFFLFVYSSVNFQFRCLIRAGIHILTHRAPQDVNSLVGCAAIYFDRFRQHASTYLSNCTVPYCRRIKVWDHHHNNLWVHPRIVEVQEQIHMSPCFVRTLHFWLFDSCHIIYRTSFEWAYF